MGTEVIMSAPPTAVISHEQPHQELPAWVSLFALVSAVLLHRAEASDGLNQIHLKRKAGYCFIDVLGFLLARACWDPHGTIKEFSRISHQNGLDKALAAILGRCEWPCDSSISRALKCVCKEDLERFHKHVMPLADVANLSTHLCTMTSDATGKPWCIFDVDGIVAAFRLRALPQSPDMPEPVRWTDEMAAPGYPGRKRGETQLSSHRLQQAGSSVWVGQGSTPGNTVMPDAVKEVVLWLTEFCRLVNLPRDQVIIRLDGAGGNVACLTALRCKGFHVAARWPNYEALDWPEVRSYLRGDVWLPVAGSGSGPQRHAAELGPGRWLAGADQLPQSMRLVVSRFLSAEENKKRGAGHLIGPAQYELFAASMDESQWPPEDVVGLYFGRATNENGFAQGNKEMGLARILCKTSPHGQSLAQLVGMLLWNLQTTLGIQLLGLPDERPPQALRSPRVMQRFADIPEVNHPPLANADEPAVPPADVTSARLPLPAVQPGELEQREQCASALEVTAGTGSDPSGPETNMTRTQAFDALRVEVEKRLGWSVDEHRGVICPAGVPMLLSRQMPASANHTLIHLRASLRACATCSCRSGCTSSKAGTFQKGLAVTVPEHLPLLRKYWPAPGAPPASTPPPEPVKPRWTPPAPVEPGRFAPQWPILIPAEVRKSFHQACENVVVRIEMPPVPPRPHQPAHLAYTAAERQRRRHTHQQRYAWNDLPHELVVRVKFLRAEHLEPIMRTVSAPAQAA